jgi:RNA polymerase sigma-70 factor (ECF subfamily)
MAITDLDEQVLVRAHQAGDEHAFGQIVRSQHRALYAHAYGRLGSHEAAEDAVQDTLLRAYRALPSFNGDLRLRAWLHRILTNVCHDEGNRRRRQAGLIDKLEALPVELAADPIDETVLHDTVRVMSEALADLPESYREALVLRYVDGLSFREVAETTGISEENARARVHRGRLALNKALARVGMLVAFMVPGLRRTRALDAGTDTVATSGASDHAVSLSTQLATHVASAAPSLSRVAAEGGSLFAAKTSIVATAVAAVAAVSAPVVAYQVYETQKGAPPPAIAAPQTDEAPTVTTTTTVVTPTSLGGSPDTTTIDALAPSTTTTLPDSALHPFVPVDGADGSDDATGGTTTTTVAPPPADDVRTPDAAVSGSLAVSGDAPNYDVAGTVVVQHEGDRLVELAGRFAFYDDGTMSGELSIGADGRTYQLRLRGSVTATDVANESTRYHFDGVYSLPGGADLGVPEHGSVLSGQFERDADGAALNLELAANAG